MAKQVVNIGALANDGTGDQLRTSFTKVNANFTETYNDIATLAGGNLAAKADLTYVQSINSNLTNLVEIVGGMSSFSGDYNDLINTPIIPSTTSQLLNNSGFITTANIPQDLSDLTDNTNLLGSPFDQALNTSDSVTFTDLNLSGYIRTRPLVDLSLRARGETQDYIATISSEDGNITIPASIIGPLQTALASSNGFGLSIDGANTPNSVDVGNLSNGKIIRIEDGEGLGAVVVKSIGSLTIQTNGFGGPGWTYDVDGNITFPDNTVQTTAWTGPVEVPVTSAGTFGDTAGSIAADTDYLYYCTANNTTASAINIPWTNVSNFSGSPEGDYIQANIADVTHLGESLRVTNISVNGVTQQYVKVVAVSTTDQVTFKIFLDAVDGTWYSFQNSTLESIGPHIWKRIAWSGDNW